MSAKPGRNDPCYCGSGKKYKRCHLPIDEQARLAAPPPVATAAVEPLEEPGEAAPDWGGELGGLDRFGDAFKMAARSGLWKRDPELRRLFKDNELLLTYLAHQHEIEAAEEKLKPHYAEFDRFCADGAAYQRQCEALFRGEAFVPFRFTAAEVRKAFQEVGVPVLSDPSRKTGKVLRKALLFLASKERRNELSMRLLLLLPKYVEQGRFIDALLIGAAAQMTAEEEKDGNPFLGRMFLYGLEDWGAAQDEARESVLRQVGFELGADADLEAVDAWMAKMQADPEGMARMQGFVNAHPELHETTDATLQAMAQQAMELFQDEASASLLLSPEELAPWSGLIQQKLAALAEQFAPAESGGKVSKAKQKKAFMEILLPAMREVAAGIFTPERIQRLVADLRVMRKAYHAAGDKAGTLRATSALLYVEPETDPGLNSFLVNLCTRSLENISGAEEAPG